MTLIRRFCLSLFMIFLIVPGYAAEKTVFTHQNSAGEAKSGFAGTDTTLYVATSKRQFDQIQRIITADGRRRTLAEYNPELLYFFVFSGETEEGKAGSSVKITRIWRYGPTEEVVNGRRVPVDTFHVEALTEEGSVQPPFLDAVSPWCSATVQRSTITEAPGSNTRYMLDEKRISYRKIVAADPFDQR